MPMAMTSINAESFYIKSINKYEEILKATK